MKKLLLAVLLLCNAISLIAQTNYYVSPTGSNSNAGTLADPFLTIQHGIDQLSAGDNLNILAGTYSEKLDLSTSGSAGQMIAIRAYQSQNVIVDADAFNNTLPIFYAGDQSYFRIEGIHFTNNYSTDGSGGIYIEGAGSHIEVVDCKFSRIAISRNVNLAVTSATNQPVVSFAGNAPATGGGTTADSLTDILVSGIEIFDCRPGFSECLTLGGNVADFEILNNHIHDNKNIGIDVIGNEGICSVASLDHARRGLVKNNHSHHNVSAYANGDPPASAGIYVDGGHDVIIENNDLHHNGYGVEIGCEQAGGAKNITCRNNLIYLNLTAGIALGGYDVSTGGLVRDSKVLNNTFYHNDTDNNGNGELLYTQFENGEVSNNIFYLSTQNYLMSNDRAQPNLSMDYNLVYCAAGQANVEAYWNNADLMNLSTIYTTTGVGAHDTWGDPIFADAGNADFHIATNSPARNNGDPLFVAATGELDIDGEARTNGIVDCGADESHGPLAVEYLEGLKAIYKKGKVILTWSTATETNSEYFVIERSDEGSIWEVIGKLDAQNNSITTTRYSTIDDNPLAGVSYYRLKQIDFDGIYEYSNVASVHIVKTKVSVFPNPTNGALNFSFSKNMTTSVSVINLLGKTLLTKEIKGEQSFINLNHLPNGLYMIKIELAGELINKKILLRK